MSNFRDEELEFLHKQFSGKNAKQIGLTPTFTNIFEDSYRVTVDNLRVLEDYLDSVYNQLLNFGEHYLPEMYADAYFSEICRVRSEIQKIADEMQNNLKKKW